MTVLTWSDDRVEQLKKLWEAGLSASQIAAAIPGSALVVIEQCGHLITMEKPAETNAILRRWLATAG